MFTFFLYTKRNNKLKKNKKIKKMFTVCFGEKFCILCSFPNKNGAHTK